MGEIEDRGKQMVALHPPACAFGLPAVPFDLPATDGRRHTLTDYQGPSGLLMMFICNHRPFAKAVIERIVRDCRELAVLGVDSVAIISNDPTAYPENSFANMVIGCSIKWHNT